MIRLAGEESRGMTHLASLGRRVSGFFTGLGGAGALAVLGDPHSGTVGILTNLLPPLYIGVERWCLFNEEGGFDLAGVSQ